MTKEQISNLFQNFKKKKVLVVGDLMIDSYLWGKVNRISPEAPVPILECTKREHRLGGAANVALNIKSAGAEVILCGITGADDKYEILKELFKKRELSEEGIMTDSSRKTTIKFRLISHGQHILRVDEEDIQTLDKENEQRFAELLLSVLKKQKPDAVIFEDYDKGALSENIIRNVTDYCNINRIPILADPKKRNFAFYKNLTLFKPNFKEICDGLKIEIDKKDTDALFKISKKLISETGNKMIMTTLSEEGVFINNSSEYYKIRAEIRDITDVSGAGDTVISIASLCLASGLDMKTTAEISNIAGGIVCEKVGVVPVNISELEKDTIEYYSNNRK